MAQLHRRIRRLPHHRLSLTAALGTLLLAAHAAPTAGYAQAAATTVVSAQVAATTDGSAQVAATTDGSAQVAATTDGSAQVAATTTVSAAELSALAGDLASDDARVRESGHAALRALDEDALPAIEARLAALRGRRPLAEDLSAAITAIRHGAGSRRADDRLDIGPGVLPALAVRRDPALLAAGESVVLWRALEAMGTTSAYRVIADIVALDGAPWDAETHRLVERAGARLGPMLVMVRSHPSPSVRRWSRWAGTELGFDAPGRAIQLPLIARDSTLLADTLAAYASVRQMDAMRVLASYAGSQHAHVREAARAALAQYGRNAIWVLREQLELVTGADANPEWGWERTMRALYEAHDDARLAPVRAELAAGQLAATRAELDVMARHYDAVLLRAPELAQRDQMAPGYARLGAQRRAAHDLAGAERAYRRAIFLAPAHADATSWRAAMLALHADMELARGVADVHAYGQVLAASPGDTAAREVLDRLSGQRAARAHTKKRLAAGGSALLLAFAALASLTRRAKARTPVEDTGGGDTSPGSLTAPAA